MEKRDFPLLQNFGAIMRKGFLPALLAGSLLTSNLYAVSWDKELPKYKKFTDPQIYSLIQRQYNAAKDNTTPKVNDEKNRKINIVESEDALLELNNHNLNTRIMSQDPNSGFSASSKMRSNLYKKLEATIYALDRHANDFGYSQGQISIKIHDITDDAVDLRLYDEETASYVDMGDLAPTFSKKINITQLKNRLYLLFATSEAGLVNHPHEFWHFRVG
mgnify:CR=1 FL=1